MNPNGPFGGPFVRERSVGYNHHVTQSFLVLILEASQRRPLVGNHHTVHTEVGRIFAKRFV